MAKVKRMATRARSGPSARGGGGGGGGGNTGKQTRTRSRPRQPLSAKGRAAANAEASESRKRKLLASLRGTNFVHVGTVDHQLLELCFKVMRTPAAEASFATLNEGIFGGTPPASLRRGDSAPQDPRQRDQIADILTRLGKEVHVWIYAVGFVPYKIRLDAESGLPMPFIPDPQQYEVRIIQNTVSRYHHLALYFFADHRSGSGGYDPNVSFFMTERTPRLNGELTSPAMSLLFAFGIYRGRGMASAAHDKRIRYGETVVQQRPEDTADSLERTEHGVVSSMDDYFDLNAQAIRASVTAEQQGFGGGGGGATRPTRIVQANYRHLVEGGGGGGDGGALKEYELVRNTRTHVVQTTAGERSMIQIPHQLDVIPMGTAVPATDLILLSEDLAGKIASVIGVPASLISTSVVAHGQGYEAMQEQLNGIICARSQLLTRALQRGIDAVYARKDEDNVRSELLELTQNRLLKKTVPALVNAQRRNVLKRLGPPELPPGTVDELQERIFVTAEEYEKRVMSNYNRVVLTPNVRVSAECIRELNELDGLISKETKNEMLIQSLNLNREQIEGSLGEGALKTKTTTAKRGEKRKAASSSEEERRKKKKLKTRAQTEKEKRKGNSRDSRTSSEAKTRRKERKR